MTAASAVADPSSGTSSQLVVGSGAAGASSLTLAQVAASSRDAQMVKLLSLP
jgi:hypothetical protein